MYPIICLIIVINFISAELLRPINNSDLNYIHILFEWEQMDNADAYQLQVAKDISFSNIIVDRIDSTLIHIEKNSIEWDNTYYWRIRSFKDNIVISDWLDYFQFTTGTTRSNASATIYDNSQYGVGVTIFGAFFDYFSGIIDENGNEIWNTGNADIVYYNTDYFGNLFGCQLRPELENNLPGMKFSLESNILWEEPNDEFLHHDIFQLPNGNYIGIIAEQQLGPIPIGPWTPLYIGLGFQADGITPEFVWEGDRIIEWDKDTKEIIWEWNTFDNYSMQDYDAIGGSWYEAIGQLRYDWTHTNAIWFDEEDSAIYISVRHLSRITKIDYPSGEIIWNMGLEMPSGEIDFGQDMLFSWQHSLQILEDGNILTLDNGNLSVQLLDTPYPTTRAIEIEVTEDNGNFYGEIVWEYNLPEELFVFASGNVEKLENGNHLITTVGGGGTSLEISSTNELVWKGNDNLTLPNGAIYRANRISSLYPIVFNVISPDFTMVDSEPTLMLEFGENNISFLVINEGSNTETFHFSFQDTESWFDNSTGEITLAPNANFSLNFLGVIPNDNNTIMNLTITPTHNPDLEKIITLNGIGIPLGIDQEELGIPTNFNISDPYPNPYNPVTYFDIDVPFTQIIEIKLYDILGRNINNIFEGELTSGKYTYELFNDNLSSGEYIISVKSKNLHINKKITLLK